MAAKLFTCQLFESKGLNKAIYFSGLSYDLIIHPYVYGEPLTSIQPIYYLDELEAIARLSVRGDTSFTLFERAYSPFNRFSR
ncbi:hypothetical protein AB9B97_25330 [Klebsiella pneumoniae]|uniref:hypothetical protein n=1 Tax=Klebsiella pneumoniae TaxID=573 RepID=UPI00350FFA00